ncbi:MAG: hypothetical protein HZA50_17640 [Planctomycetes bacterium]|nr:hypothetical protein [Planctomycetota bacterium]
MSIRSLIAQQTKDGIEAIYCHNGGFPENQLPILTKNYVTDKKVARLIALGDLSVLGQRLGKKHDYEMHGGDALSKKWCLAYGRDRGEKKTRKRKYSSESDFLADASKRWADFVYIFRDGKWLYRKIGEQPEWTEC